MDAKIIKFTLDQHFDCTTLIERQSRLTANSL